MRLLTLGVLVVFGVFVVWPYYQSRHTSAIASNRAVKATVTEVVDGNTLRVNAPACHGCEVRLRGIAAPVGDQPFAAQARQMLVDLTGGKGAQINLEASPVQGYAHQVAEVWHDHVHVNWAMIEQGGARVYDYYLHSPHVEQLQTAARAAGKGLWGLASALGTDQAEDAAQSVQGLADAVTQIIRDAGHAIKGLFGG